MARLDPDSNAVQLQNLPGEILHRICEHLESVVNLRLASKQFLAAANATFYSSIVIRHSTAEALVQDTKHWKHHLQIAQGFQHVRFLRLKTTVPESRWTTDFRDVYDEQLQQRWQLMHDCRRVTPGDDQDQEWRVVADFVRALPGLSEVHYACWPQLAPCLLAAIEERGCRLFHHSFAVRSLWQSPKQSINVNAYELKLATSPSLHSLISTKFEDLDEVGCLNFLEQAAMTLASGCAPNLTSVSLCYWIGEESPATAFGRRLKPPIWKGTEFGSPARPSEQKGSLRSLELAHPAICTLDKLKRWADATDFSELTTLKLHHNVGTSIMRWLAMSVQLNNLHDLVLRLTAYQEEFHSENIDMNEERSELMRLFVTLSETLPSLRYLRIYGDCTFEAVRQFLEPHSATVQRLAIFPSHRPPLYCPRNDIVGEQWKCSNLTDLSIVVRRNAGDESEVQLYKWIGVNFPNLRRLFLSVDCSYAGPQLDENSAGLDSPAIHRQLDGKLYDLTHVLRNYAIDQNLVAAIYHTISGAKPSRSPPLERLELKIHPLGLGALPGDFLKLCATVLGRNWVCQSRYVDGQTNRLVYENFNTDVEDLIVGPDIDERAVEIFHLVWPEQPGKSWRESWQSFPLVL